MFRSEPREKSTRLNELRILAQGPGVGKYSPNVGYIMKNVNTGHVKIDNKKELANKEEVEKRKRDIVPPQVCSKGVSKCFGSFNRVKE